MNIELGKFFYNIIPGGLNLFLWLWIYDVKTGKLSAYLRNDSPLKSSELAILFLIFSLFVGYCLQGLWKIIKNLAHIDLMINLLNGRKQEDLELYRFVNAYLWANNSQSLSEYYAYYSAIWSNTVVGSLITVLILILVDIDNLGLLLFVQVVVLFLSIYFYFHYKNSQFSSVLRQGKVLNEKSLEKEIIALKAEQKK